MIPLTNGFAREYEMRINEKKHWFLTLTHGSLCFGLLLFALLVLENVGNIPWIPAMSLCGLVCYGYWWYETRERSKRLCTNGAEIDCPRVCLDFTTDSCHITYKNRTFSCAKEELLASVLENTVLLVAQSQERVLQLRFPYLPEELRDALRDHMEIIGEENA